MSRPTDPIQDVLWQAFRSHPRKRMIFGAGGDLTRRLRLPPLYNLYNLAMAKILPDDFEIVAIDRAEQTGQDWVARLFLLAEQDAKDPIAEFSTSHLDWAVCDRPMQNARYIAGDFTRAEPSARLTEAVGDDSAIFCCVA